MSISEEQFNGHPARDPAVRGMAGRAPHARPGRPHPQAHADDARGHGRLGDLETDMIPEVFQTLGIALGLGLLVGLQRERSDSRWAGIRTFPLITWRPRIESISQPAGG
jgi:hypothetical protein